ncbi:MAG: hypothetical protein JO341_00400 [Gammaproteobacteria bacterium]|nr:hypothetical protein [Gammaproteobacteria bacterium]
MERSVWRAVRGLTWFALAALGVAAGRAPEPVALGAGARVGIISLLDAEVTHVHAARQVQDSFLKTYRVGWAVSVMLTQAASPLLEQRHLAAVPLEADAALRRLRASCLVAANPAKALPKECALGFAQFMSAQHLDALLILGPAPNDGAHGPRRKDLPEYLRGWCAVTGASAGPAAALLNLTELLLVAVGPPGAVVVGHQWGGAGEAAQWGGFAPGTDLHALGERQLDPLQPRFAEMLRQQAGAVLAQLPLNQR